MQWAVKRYLVATALILLVAFFAVFITSRERISLEYFPIETKPGRVLTCFSSSDTSLRVTTENLCPDGLIPLGSSALVESATASGEIKEIHPLLQNRFDAAKAAALSDGVHLYITSGFRSYARQKYLFEREIQIRGSETEAAKWVLPPNFSHHPHGLAIDVNYPGDPTGAKWLEDNGSRFGLCRVYANEWWHFEGAIAPGELCPTMSPNALVDLG